MRHLATIQRISSITPIEGADRIECAKVLGWHVVVIKGQFKPGDLCIYCEIDSILPSTTKEFAFLEGKRIRTKKLRGVVSQGICFELYPLLKNYTDDIVEGLDVTEYLGITKWEPDIYNTKDSKDKVQAPKKWYMKFAIGRWFWRKFLYKPSKINFPEWIRKSDQTRVQILQKELTENKGTWCMMTEKVDGSSITMWIDKKKNFHVCSRNYEILNPEDTFVKTATQIIKDKLMQLEPMTVLQGELLGPKIQQNKYGLTKYDILIYTVISPEGEYLKPTEVSDLMKSVDIATVPYLGTFKLSDDIDEIVRMAEGKTMYGNNPKAEREGIVIRSLQNTIIKNDHNFPEGRLSFKAINPKFLLKYDA